MNISDISAKIGSDVFSTLGITPELKEVCKADLKEKLIAIGTFSLNTNFFGPMSSVFESASVTVRAGLDASETIHMVYAYKWEHSQGGSNGYDVRKALK